MQVTISELSPVEKKVAVELPWPAVQVKLDEAYRDLQRSVALKGYRKGKVPRDMLERMYGRQVEQDLIQKLVQETFIQAATDHKLEPVSEPVVNDAHLHKGKNFHYSALVEVRSVIEPKDYFDATVTQRGAKVTDEEVERTLDQKRRELTEYKVIDAAQRPDMLVGASDVLVLRVVGTLGDAPYEKDGFMVDLSEPSADAIPGMGKAMLGIPVAAKEHEVTFTSPAPEAKEGETKGEDKKVTLKVTVHEAREKVIPSMDDEFAKDTGEADTLAELRDKTKTRMLAEDDKAAKAEVRRDLVKEILKKNPFPVATSLVDRQLDALVQRAKIQMMMRGVDPRALEAQGQLDTQRMRDDLREEANDEVRAAFLVDAIASVEKIEVSDAEYEKKLADMAESRQKSVPKLKAELQKEGRLDAVRYQLREEKTLDLLMSRAKINVAP
ncbi:MAG: trigger factor [Polyangia bacterium]